jgi:hypothetical protein
MVPDAAREGRGNPAACEVELGIANPFGRAGSCPGLPWLKQRLEHLASMRAASERILML